MADKSLPPLNWLRAFEASARHLSFTGAAHELNMTQSAVSQQIKSLENFFGKPLFFRKVRALELTETGQSYLPTVQQAFLTLTRGTRSIVGQDRGQALDVQSNLAFSVFWLAPRLPRLYARHPWLTLNVTTALWTPERTAGFAELEIRLGRKMSDGVRAQQLNRDSYFPVCGPGVSVDETSLQTFPWFDCSGLSCNWEAWHSGLGRPYPHGKIVNLATTFAVSLSAAQSGAGIALAHETIADDLIARGLLKRPFEVSVPMQEAYFLITSSAETVTPAARVFQDWLLEEFGL